MSQNGSVARAAAGLSVLRLPLAVLSMGCALLTGCERRVAAPDTPPAVAPDALVHTVIAGYDAFWAGDRDALAAAIQRLDARLPSDETHGVFIACSTHRAELWRTERARRVLKYLDNPTVLSMAGEEKFIYFQQYVEGDYSQIDARGRLVLFNEPNLPDVLNNPNAPSDFECERTAGYDRSLIVNSKQDKLLQAAGRARLRDWLINLRQSLDTQLAPRMQNAAVELQRNQLRFSSDDWRPPTVQPADVQPSGPF